MIKSSFNAGIYFSALHFFKELITKTQSMNERMTNSTSSALARGLQSVMTNPIIVIKTRFEVLGFNEYTSLIDAVKKVKV